MRRALLPLRRSHALAVAALAVGLAAGVVVGPMLTADASVTPIRAGQFCTPRGAVYRTTTLTLLCAQSISLTRLVDPAWRWRSIATLACPVGYVRQILHVYALPRGATGWRPVQVAECVLASTATPTVTPSPTPFVTPSSRPRPTGTQPAPVG